MSGKVAFWPFDVGLIVVNADHRTVLEKGTHRQGRAIGRQRDAVAEVIAHVGTSENLAITIGCPAGRCLVEPGNVVHGVRRS